MLLQITDAIVPDRTVTVEPDVLADTISEWYFGAPDEVFSAMLELQNAWTQDAPAQYRDGLAAYLAVTVTPVG